MKCVVCESFKDLISKLRNSSTEVLESEAKLKNKSCTKNHVKNLYYIWRIELVQSKDEFLCIIHDTMDHAKIDLPRLQMCNKMVFGLG
jgi:hypothetical protein